MQLASRASHTRSQSHSPRVLTHAAATWPAVPPTSDDASGLIVDWKEVHDHDPSGLVGVRAGARRFKRRRRHGGRGAGCNGCGTGVVGWVQSKLISRHAEAVARLNCRASEMVIHTNLGIYLL